MGIRFYCPNGHKLNVKAFQAGRRGICPYCGASVLIPTESTRGTGKRRTATAPEQRAATPSQLAPQPAPLSTGPAVAIPVAPMADPSVGQTVARAPMPQPAAPLPATPLAAGSQPTTVLPTVPQPTPSVLSADGAAPVAFPAVVAPAAPVTQPPVPQVAQGAAAIADPLAEAPNAVWYVRPASGGQYGPATAEVMRTWLAEGRIGADTLVWREGWRDWQQAAGVFPQLKPDDIALFLSGATVGAAAQSRTGTPAYPPSRRRSNSSTVMIITGLVLAVVVLAVVFLMVLFQQP